MNFKVKDFYFKKAKKENFLARSIYKLEEIDKRFKLLKRGDHVLDLGYYPGSWMQYTQKIVGENGSVVGVDIKPINQELLKFRNIRLFQHDFLASDLLETIESDKFDVVLSDMAPNTTGIRNVDQDRSYELVDNLFKILSTILKTDGNFVVKVFEGEQYQKSLPVWKKRFKEVHLLRPKSTRTSSKEIFLIGKGLLRENEKI